MFKVLSRNRFCAAALLCNAALPATSMAAPKAFHFEEATIAQIQSAILNKQITTEQALRLYLVRIKAYNGICVKQPQGLLGPMETIANAGQLNAISTLNLRRANRKALGFDDRKARSNTDLINKANYYNDPNFASQKVARENADKPMELNTAERMQRCWQPNIANHRLALGRWRVSHRHLPMRW
jgi:hypothetical protein